MTIVGRGRDLHTPASGDAKVLESVRIDADIDFSAGVVKRISAEPSIPGISELTGAHAFGGFRMRVSGAMPAARDSGSVSFQILDDLPIALLLSARVLRAAGMGLNKVGAQQKPPIDICAGWVAGGTADIGTTNLGPPLNLGPKASVIVRDDDELGWHEFDALPPHSTRRHRRIDVWRDGDSGYVDCFFRDSFSPSNGIETVVHQYRIRATIDPKTSRFISCEAEAGPLPYPECPNALASADRLAGADVGGLRREVRDSFVGPTTCTHLNDTLRSLEDVGALLCHLDEAWSRSN